MTEPDVHTAQRGSSPSHRGRRTACPGPHGASRVTDSACLRRSDLSAGSDTYFPPPGYDDITFRRTDDRQKFLSLLLRDVILGEDFLEDGDHPIPLALGDVEV